MRQIASLLLTLAPAAYLWWSGRRLVRRIDDPAFPELRFADAQRATLVIAVCAALVWVLSTTLWVLKAAILLLAILVARFPTRRAIFDESWSLLAYLSHTIRLWAAGLGLWLLLAIQPTLVRWSGANAAPTAIALFLTLLLYSHFSDRVLLRLWRATPLDDPEIEAHLRTGLRGARCSVPRLLRLDAPGGRWVNAFALPSRKQPAVLFTADLLEALTPDETRAIFAHEVAHLEYFHPRRLLQREVAVGLLAFAPLLVLLLYGSESPTLASLTWVWPLVVVIFLVALLAHNQKREHSSDLRALELVGEPESLISALTKIHHLMKMPRRWRPDAEARMSHPSLAKRLRAIRDAAASRGLAGEEVELASRLVVRSADAPGEWVILASDRLHWLTAVDPESPPDADALLQAAGDCRSMRYTDLRDLRLEARGSKQRQLTVVDSRGQTLKLRIAPDDVESVKSAIERLDLKVEGTAVEAGRRHATQAAQRRNARLLGALACLVALLPPFSLPLLAAGGLVLARVSTASMAAAGAVALGVAALGTRETSPYLGGGSSPALILVAALLGGLLLVAAFRRARRGQGDDQGAAKLTLLILAALAILYTIPGVGRLSAPLPAMQLHLWARYQPAVAVALLGFAAALFSLRPKLARLSALVAGTAAVATIVIGTHWFRDHYTNDVLARAGRMMTAPAWRPAKIRELTIVGNVTDLRIAPSGAKIAARVYEWSAQDQRVAESRFMVESSDETMVELQAIDLAFLDDDRVAVLSASRNGLLSLRTLALEPEPTARSEIPLPALDMPTLRVDAATFRWEVADTDPYEGTATLLSGDFGSEEYQEVRWTGLHATADAYISAVAASGNRQALVLSQRYAEQRFASLALMLAPLAGLASAYDIELVIDTLHSHLAQTALPVWCVEPPAGSSDFICASNDSGSATHFWSVDGQTRSLSFVGSLPAPYYQGHQSASGALLVNGYGGPPVLIDPSSGTARTLDLQASLPGSERSPLSANVDDGTVAMDGNETSAGFLVLDQLLSGLFSRHYSGRFYNAMALTDKALALAVSVGESSTVTLYRLDADESGR